MAPGALGMWDAGKAVEAGPADAFEVKELLLGVPESLGVMEPDLAVVAARVGGRVRLDVLGVMEMAGGAAMLAAFSKSSTCREAGRLLLPPVRPLNCCALDLPGGARTGGRSSPGIGPAAALAAAAAPLWLVAAVVSVLSRWDGEAKAEPPCDAPSSRRSRGLLAGVRGADNQVGTGGTAAGSQTSHLAGLRPKAVTGATALSLTFLQKVWEAGSNSWVMG